MRSGLRSMARLPGAASGREVPALLLPAQRGFGRRVRPLGGRAAGRRGVRRPTARPGRPVVRARLHSDGAPGRCHRGGGRRSVGRSRSSVTASGPWSRTRWRGSCARPAGGSRTGSSHRPARLRTCPHRRADPPAARRRAGRLDRPGVRIAARRDHRGPGPAADGSSRPPLRLRARGDLRVPCRKSRWTARSR